MRDFDLLRISAVLGVHVSHVLRLAGCQACGGNLGAWLSESFVPGAATGHCEGQGLLPDLGEALELPERPPCRNSRVVNDRQCTFILVHPTCRNAPAAWTHIARRLLLDGHTWEKPVLKLLVLRAVNFVLMPEISRFMNCKALHYTPASKQECGQGVFQM